MDIWSIDKFQIFIAFVIPGFVSLKAYDLLIPSEAKDSTKQLVDAIAYSCINYALLFWPIYEVETNNVSLNYPRLYITFYAFVLLIAPVVWVLLFKWLRISEYFQTIMPHPTSKPWDYVFAQRKPYWVVVTLKDNRKIAGRYEDSSFASSSPAPEQLYLEESWCLSDEGGFDRKKNNTAGVMILSPDIVMIEFFELTYGENCV